VPVSAALIGLGDIALRGHLPALLANPDISLVAVADVDPDAVDRARAAAPTATTDVGRVLDDPTIDAVVIATPPQVTPMLAERALASGKYVLAEKPLAPTLREARLLADTPNARERLQIGLTYRHHPAVERLRDLVVGGALGRPLLIQASLCDEPAEPDRDPDGFARRLRSLEHAPPVISDGIHACDRLNIVLGASPTAIHGFSLRSDDNYASPNTNIGILEYEDGSLVRLEVIWLVPLLPPSQFVVTGPLGSAVLDPPTFDLVVDLASGEREHCPPPGDKTQICFERQLASFVSASRTRSNPVPGVVEALASLDLAERIAEAAGIVRVETS
jgi:myo-inositol 2-dehydrogenase / D-chiro-inositol 1-dehydrogenase